MNNFDKALLQIITARGVVEDGELRRMAQQLRTEEGAPNPSTPAGRSEGGAVSPAPEDFPIIFSKINAHLRRVSLEIKTLAISDSTSANSGSQNAELRFFHSITNNVEDSVAVENGSTFNAIELAYLKDIIETLVEHRQLSTQDIIEFRPSKITNTEAGAFLDKLEAERWLERDKRNYWIIGCRSHLELRSLIEDVLRKIIDGSESSRSVEAELPQIIYY